MSVKIVFVRRSVCVQILASMLLLSSCSEEDSFDGPLADDDCTPSTNLSTTLQTEVDINGNISLVPVASNTVSGCGLSAAEGDHFDSSLITTRFETTEDLDVWDCIESDGSSVQYALLSFDDFTHLAWWRYAVEINLNAEDLDTSQQLFGWRVFRSTNADTITFKTWERVNKAPTDSVESEWTDITFATEDDMSFTSSTKGAMQCKRTLSAVNVAASRFDFACKYRGPITAC